PVARVSDLGDAPAPLHREVGTEPDALGLPAALEETRARVSLAEVRAADPGDLVAPALVVAAVPPRARSTDVAEDAGVAVCAHPARLAGEPVRARIAEMEERLARPRATRRAAILRLAVRAGRGAFDVVVAAVAVSDRAGEADRARRRHAGGVA